MTSAALDRMSIARDKNVAALAFGLSTAPFEAAPDPCFLYAHGGVQSVCAELLAFDMSERPGLFLITGAPGTGKTILLQSMLEDRRLGERCLALSCAGGLSFEALVRAWCAALGIAREVAVHATRRSVLGAHLTAQGGAAVLLLDDAEALEDGALRDLCDLAVSSGAARRLARIVLAGRPELEARLARPELSELQQAVAFQTCLQVMPEPEVEAYMRHRLTVAGHQAADELFSAQAVEVVARASSGVPRLVNILCRVALEIAAADGRPTVSAEQIEASIQACLLHAQDSLAAQDLSPPPGIAAAGPGPAVTAGPAPPRPEGRWPLAIKTKPATAGAIWVDAAAGRSGHHRLLRAAPGLLAGLALGLAVATLYPARLGPPKAVAPDLLLSTHDDKARSLGGEPDASVANPSIGPALHPARLEAATAADPIASTPAQQTSGTSAEAPKRESGPTSWLNQLAEFFTTAEPGKRPRRFGQHRDP